VSKNIYPYASQENEEGNDLKIKWVNIRDFFILLVYFYRSYSKKIRNGGKGDSKNLTYILI